MGTKYGEPDALPKRGKAKEDFEDEDLEDLEDEMDLYLAVAIVLPKDVLPAECLNKVPQVRWPGCTK